MNEHVQKQGGFTYLLLLVMLSALAFSMLKSRDGDNMRHREQLEAELLFRGEQIRLAIASYRSRKNGITGCFPVTFEQLLRDTRGQKPVFHLRQHYHDPLTNHKTWGMIYDQQGRWIGVHSLGEGIPRKKTGFTNDADAFTKAKSYIEWKFQVDSDPLAPLPKMCDR